jgi:hypothetical protein
MDANGPVRRSGYHTIPIAREDEQPVSLRPVTLRPHLSIGLPFLRVRYLID